MWVVCKRFKKQSNLRRVPSLLWSVECSVGEKTHRVTVVVCSINEYWHQSEVRPVEATTHTLKYGGMTSCGYMLSRNNVYHVPGTRYQYIYYTRRLAPRAAFAAPATLTRAERERRTNKGSAWVPTFAGTSFLCLG